MHRFLILTTIFLLYLTSLQSQESVTLEQCREWAQSASPLVKQKEFAAKMMESNLESIISQYFYPQLSLNGQATYQTDVTWFPVDNINLGGTQIPIQTIFPMDKPNNFQYQVRLDLNQTILDGAMIYNPRKLQKPAIDAELQKYDIGLFSLQENITAFYLSVLLIDENLKVLDLHINKLNKDLENAKVLESQGTILATASDEIETGILKLQQQKIELRTSLKNILTAMSELTGKDLNNAKFTQPEVNSDTTTVSRRPEYDLYKFQKSSLESSIKYNNTKVIPRITLFGNGGVGNPGLNMLLNESKFYAYLGLKINVPITGWIEVSNSNKEERFKQKLIDEQENDFAIQNSIKIKQCAEDINKFEQLISQDNLIIKKREDISATAKKQFESGVITSTEYLKIIDSEMEAVLNLKLHQIQLTQAKLNYKLQLGII